LCGAAPEILAKQWRPGASQGRGPAAGKGEVLQALTPSEFRIPSTANSSLKGEKVRKGAVVRNGNTSNIAKTDGPEEIRCPGALKGIADRSRSINKGAGWRRGKR